MVAVTPSGPGAFVLPKRKTTCRSSSSVAQSSSLFDGQCADRAGRTKQSPKKEDARCSAVRSSERMGSPFESQTGCAEKGGRERERKRPYSRSDLDLTGEGQRKACKSKQALAPVLCTASDHFSLVLLAFALGRSFCGHFS